MMSQNSYNDLIFTGCRWTSSTACPGAFAWQLHLLWPVRVRGKRVRRVCQCVVSVLMFSYMYMYVPVCVSVYKYTCVYLCVLCVYQFCPILAR